MKQNFAVRQRPATTLIKSYSNAAQDSMINGNANPKCSFLKKLYSASRDGDDGFKFWKAVEAENNILIVV